MVTAIQAPEDPAIEYPDDDGNPMSDKMLQYDWMVTIKEGLDKLFRDEPNVLIAGNLLWYPVLGDPTIRMAPDAMVAIGRPKGRRGSYKQWQEADHPPDVVFEVLSPGNRAVEMERKLQFYDKYGVEEYYVYDPDDGSLEGWIRSGNHLQAVPQMSGHVSPLLDIRFEPGDGPDSLRIIYPDGSRFLTREEEQKQFEADKRQADNHAEQQRRIAIAKTQLAEEERLRAEEERLRAERLAARLRELGVEPD
jgi:Uma2 family endonuclease